VVRNTCRREEKRNPALAEIQEKTEKMKHNYFRYVALVVLTFQQVIFTLPSYAQCEEVEAVLKDIITKGIRPTVIERTYDTFEKISCITLNKIDEDDFILLGRGLEYSDITQYDPHTVEYNILRMVDKEKGVACEHIFIKRKKDSSPIPLTYNQFQRQRILNLIKAKEEALALLKKQQKYLSTDILNILGDVVVGQIDSPSIPKIFSEVAKRLKEKGIEQVSRYWGLEYVPSENETADFVRQIVEPVDKVLSASGIDTGKFLKYWEAVKFTPDAGMTTGNVAAKIRIYFMEEELQKDIDDLKKRLEQMPADTPYNVHTGVLEEDAYLKNGEKRR
jgi:hypothetical protein